MHNFLRLVLGKGVQALEYGPWVPNGTGTGLSPPGVEHPSQTCCKNWLERVQSSLPGEIFPPHHTAISALVAVCTGQALGKVCYRCGAEIAAES